MSNLDQIKLKRPPIDPLTATESLGFQTFRRETRKPWTKDEDFLLIKLYQENFSTVSSDLVKWETISRHFVNRKPKDCRKRWQNSLDPSLKKGKWTTEEDEKLVEAYHKFGASWQKVSNEITGRTDDQCAKRYIEVLDPNTKDRLRAWEKEEDLELIRKVKKYGTKWRTISMEMIGRPSLTCRNRWRKIVTSVVRGKADDVIRQEVELVKHELESLSNEIKKSEIDDDIESKHDADELENNIKDEQPQPAPKSSNTQSVQQSKSNDPNYISSTQSSIPQSKIPQKNNQPQTFTNQSNTSSFKPRSSSNGSLPLPQSNLKSNNRFEGSASSPRPVQSEIEWKYSLQNHHGEPIPEGFGDVTSQETVQDLITVAKKYNLAITVHQHIHHHYAPQPQPLLEPETQLTRYQHFNYLPPLTEVPKLNSSASSPANSSNESNNKESDLMKLLNNNQGNGNSRISPRNSFIGMSEHNRSRSLSRMNSRKHHLPQTSNNSNSVYKKPKLPKPFANGNQQSKLNHSITSPSHSINSNSSNSSKLRSEQRTPQKHFTTEELDEELDFWETMRTLTQVSNHNNGNNGNLPTPVSQHHPLHYAGQKLANYHNGGINDDDESEVSDEEDHVNKYGLYYNIFTNKEQAHQNQSDERHHSVTSQNSWQMPSNPS